MSRFYRGLFLFVGIFIFSSTSATACDYTVGLNEEFTDIQTAIRKAESDGPAGKEVCIKDDKEYVTTRITVNGSGTAAEPFVIKKHPSSDTRPILKDISTYEAGKTHAPLFLLRGSYIIVENLEISRTTGIAFQSYLGRNNTFKDNVTHNIFTVAYKIMESPGTKVDGCIVYEAGISASPACRASESCNVWPENHPEIVNISMSYNNELTNCTIYNVYGGTISSVRSYNTRIANNHIYDTLRSLLHLDQARKVIVENNIVYTSTNGSFEKEDGLYKLDEYYETSINPPDVGVLDFRQPQGQERTIRNNIFINTEWGLNFGKCEKLVGRTTADKPITENTDENCWLKDDIIENNTVLSSSRGILRLSAHQYSENNLVRNNIFHTLTTGSSATNEGVSGGFTFTNNIWNKEPPAFFRGNSDQIKNTTEIKNMFDDPNKIFNDSILLAGTVDPLWFKVKSQYSQWGADVEKVGPNKYSPDTSNPPASIEPSPPSNPSPNPLCSNSADTNQDGKVDIFDYNSVVANFLQQVSPNSPTDINCDQVVDIFDYNMVVTQFQAT